MDVLADLLDGVHARSAAFCRSVLEPPWALRIDDRARLALATAVRGQAWIVPDDDSPVQLRTGDVAIVKGPAPYTVCDAPSTSPQLIVGPGNRATTLDNADLIGDPRFEWPADRELPAAATIVASGTYQIESDLSQRLLNALPRIVLVPEPAVRSPVMELLSQEVSRDEPGQQVFLDRLLDLALIAALRAWFARPEAEAPGWYQAMGDPLVGPALRLIHDHPAEPWTVASLATKAGGSRAALARRFTALVGEPPMAYLAGWRVALAADRLRGSTATVEAIARQVGYASAFALSVAFKRVRGITPSRYRAGARYGSGVT